MSWNLYNLCAEARLQTCNVLHNASLEKYIYSHKLIQATHSVQETDTDFYHEHILIHKDRKTAAVISYHLHLFKVRVQPVLQPAQPSSTLRSASKIHTFVIKKLEGMCLCFILHYLQSAFPNWKVIKGVGHPNIAVIKVWDNVIL